MDTLHITHLKKCFGSKEVLCDLNLSVPRHSIFGFVGKNGAGKTTTMKAILGLLKPDSGTIFVEGEKVLYGQTPTNHHIGYLPDVPSFYSYMTPVEYLKLCGQVCGMTNHQIAVRSQELLSLVGLQQETHRIKGFSRGMKQRLGIAQALLHQPKLLIADEPTSALDPAGRREILDILTNASVYTTVVFSTHILSDVEQVCTHAAILNEGKIVMENSIEQIKTLHRRKEFSLKLSSPVHAQEILRKFPNAEKTDAIHLLFKEETTPMSAVLQYLAEKRIPLEKIERRTPSLESLFMEVTQA